MRPFLIISLAVAGATAAAAPAASADSLVYVKDGNPYISAPDGSDAQLVTTNDPGDWTHVAATTDGTVFAAQDDGSIGVYPPGAPPAPTQSIASGLGLSAFAVAPDGSSVADTVLDTSPIDHSFRHNSHWENLADDTGGEKLSEYWPSYAGPTQLWLHGGGLDAVNPLDGGQWSGLPPALVDGLEAVYDEDGHVAAIRSGGGVEDFSYDACPEGETCQTSSSTLIVVRYDATWSSVVGRCQLPNGAFQNLAINGAGTAVAFDRPDGVHEIRLGDLSNGCGGSTDLGLVVPGARSAGFTDSDNRAFPNAPAPEAPLAPTPTPAPPATGTVDAITHVAIAKHTVKRGTPIALTVTLRSKSAIKVTVYRHVAASGHGKHRHPARYTSVGVVRSAGKAGKNTVRITKVGGRRLKAGRYQARIVAGGATHAVTFTVT